MLIKYKKLNPEATCFGYSREGDACLDMYSIEKITIPAHESVIIHTGIAVEIPEGYEGIVRGRSGLASKGIITHVGTIDSTYRGDVGIVLYNSTDFYYTVEKFDRVGQFSIHPITKLNLIESNELSETIRGESGYGSSGK